MPDPVNGYRKKVSYYYDHDIGNFYYGQGHPMKPNRIRMTHSLILNYGLYWHMNCYAPSRATVRDMTRFHAEDYITFLKTVTPDKLVDSSRQMQRYNVGEDCPVFTDLYEFCSISAGGSIAAAAKLNSGASDLTINWAGGMHHAKKSESSGFCYVNDIALAILELLRCHQRVLYVDIDVHHGDGVEEAFYTHDRVMTISFHKYGEYFPGTGDLKDIGVGKGKYHALNVPLRDGMDDQSYEHIFKTVMDRVMSSYNPGAVVMQCGADSLAGDRLGCFNLSMRGHGGGGYTIRNVSRCWAYETSLTTGVELPNSIPYNDYYEYYSPSFKLHIEPSTMINQNEPAYLDGLIRKLFEHLRAVGGTAPGVQMHDVPESSTTTATEASISTRIAHSMLEEEARVLENVHPDSRPNRDLAHSRIIRDEELSDSDDERDPHNARRNFQSHYGAAVTAAAEEEDAGTTADCSKRPRLDAIHRSTNSPAIHKQTNAQSSNDDDIEMVEEDEDGNPPSRHR